MQAPGKPGPKILFEVSQVESSVRCRIYVTASSQGWARHPHTPLPESDSGKITIQGWAESALVADEAQRGSSCRWASPDEARLSPNLQIGDLLTHHATASARPPGCAG